MLPRGNGTANRQIAVNAHRAHTRRRAFASVDMGGGGSRIGGRVTPVSRPSKSELLRPSRNDD